MAPDDVVNGYFAAANGNTPAPIESKEILSIFSIEENDRVVLLQRSCL
jgi:hypothetical protein